MRPNALEFAQSAALLPLRMLGLARNFVGQLGSASLIDLAVGLAEAPAVRPLRRQRHRAVPGRRCSATPTATNDFRLLENELYLTATDLDTCERIVLGGEDWDDVPISQAVAASTALPMVYKPVEIKGRHLVDGGIRSTTNVDIAVERGRQVRDRRQPARPVRQRLPEGHPDDVGQPRAARAPTWASRRSATRPSSCSPTSACTRRCATGRSSTRASTSS